MKSLLFELPAQAHPPPGHQLHLRHTDHLDKEDVDQDDSLGKEVVADQSDDFDNDI